MTLEESIALADKFQKDLAQLESCERQIKDNNEAMSKPAKINVRRRSMFRYFWPWIIFAATVCCMILALSIIFLTSRYAKFSLLVTVLAYVIGIAILFIGVAVSRKKAKEDNEAYEVALDMASKKRADLLAKNDELESKINSLKIQLGGNIDYKKIPYDKRKSSSMARAKLLLQSGKATDFEDVLGKI